MIAPLPQLAQQQPQPSAANSTRIEAATYEFEVHGVQVEGAGGLGGPDERSQPDVQVAASSLLLKTCCTYLERLAVLNYSALN